MKRSLLSFNKIMNACGFTKKLSKGLILFLCTCYAFSFKGFGQTTVLYQQQTGNYTAGPLWTSGTSGTYNPNGFQMGMYSHGITPECVAWRSFKTAGDNTGSARSLQVGDEFRISVSAHTVFGQMGFALLASPSSYSSYADRYNNALIALNLDNFGNWYAKLNAGNTTGTALVGANTTYKNFVFTCLLTAPDRMNVTITDGTTTTNMYDLLLNSSNPITDFSVYLSDDWDGTANKDIFWNTNTTAHADYVKNTGVLPIGLSNNTFTISSVIPNPTTAADGSASPPENVLTKSGSGTLTLSGANTYSGLTTISSGTVKLGNASALGTTTAGTTITTGAVLDLNGTNYSNTEALTVNGTGISSGGAVINSNAATGTYAGLLTLGSTSSIVGGTGLINISNAGTITGATFGLTLGGAVGGTISSIIGTTTGSLIKVDAGTWTLSGANTYSGATTVSTGTLKYGVVGAISSSSPVTVNGTLDINGFSPAIGSLAGSGTITSGAAGALTVSVGSLNTSTTFSGVIQNGSATSVGLTKTGSGTFTLSGTNSSYTGVTTINGGTVAYHSIQNYSVNSSLGAPASGSINFTGTGTLQFIGASNSTSNRTINFTNPGVGTIDASGTSGAILTLNGAVTSNAGALNPTFSGTGTGIMNGSVNTNANSRIIKSGTGTWTFSAAAGSGINQAPIISGGTLIQAISTAIGGTANTGAMSLSGTYQYTGSSAFNMNTVSPVYAITLGSASTIDQSGAGLLTTPAIANGGFTLTMQGSTAGTAAGIISGTGGLTKLGANTWSLNAANTYTGTTTINAGTLQLGVTNALRTGSAGNRTNVVLNGGTLSSGSGTGFSQGSSTSSCIGTLSLLNNSIINLGTGNHSVYFAASTGATWTTGMTLTITGWTGGMGTTGTSGHIYISTGGLSSTQLAQITFSGFPAGAMLIGGSGEIVPAIVATTYYSQCTCAFETFTNWNSSRTGGGYSPGSFSLVTGDKFIVQGTGGGLGAPHIMTSGNTVTFGATGKNVTVEVEGGGTLIETSNITITAGSTFQLDANSFYTHNTTNATEIVKGTESWDVTSTITFTRNGFMASSSITGAYPNVIIQTGSNDDNTGVITQIDGNLTINQGSGKIFYIKRANTGANAILTVNKSVFVSTGILDLSQDATSNTLNIAGDGLSISSGALITNSGSLASGTATINFTKNGTATYTDANASGGGLAVKPVNFAVISPCVLDMATQIMGPSTGTFTLNSGAGIITANTNTTGALTSSGANGSIQVTGTRTFSTGADYTYNSATTAQYTGNGLPASVHNLTINNGSATGVTLNNTGVSVTISNNGTTNGTLYLTNGIFNTITNSGVVIVPQNQSVSRTNGWVYGSLRKYVSASTNFEVGDATYYTNVNVNGTTSITTPGLFTVMTNTLTEHPNIATSSIDQTKDDNSYFTLTNSGPVVFNGGATLVFNYPSGDIDGGATATNFKLGNYNPTTWLYPVSITAAANSMTVTGQTTFGDFQAGESSCGTFGVWTGASSTEWNLSANWCGGIPTATSDVVIPNVTNKPLISTANAVAKTITINAGSSLTMSGTYNLTLSGNAFTNNAGASGFVASSSTGALIFTTVSTATISGTNTFQNISTSVGLDFGTASTVNGTFTINSNGYVTNSHPPIYNCSSTLKYNTGGVFGRNQEWTAAISGAGYPGNVLVSSGTTLNYNNSGAGVNGSLCGDLTVDGSLYMDYSSSGSASLKVGNDVTINGNLSLGQNSGGDLYVAGDYTAGASSTINNKGRATFFNGTSGTQIITKTGGGNVYFDKLIKSGNSVLQLNNSPATTVRILSTVNNAALNVLEISAGSIDLNGQTFELNGTVANSTNIGVDGGTTRNITSSSGTGTFAVTGSASAGSQNLNINVMSANSKLIFGTGVNVTTQVGLDFGLNGVACEIDGILQINTNGFVIGHSPDYGSSSTLIYNNGSGGFKRNLEWTANSPGATGAGYPNNIIVQNNTPLTLNITHLAPNALGCSGYIDIKSGSSMDMNDMPYSLTAGTNMIIGGTLILSTVSGGDLNVGQNWDRAAAGVFTQNGRNVTFNGSADGTLTANGNGQLFSYVYLNKSAVGNKLTLLDNVAVSDETAFTQGTLDLGTKYFTLLSTATKTARVGQSVSANTAFTYGAGNVTGQFIIQRYVPAKRAWRLMSPPLKSSGGTHTISQAWQEGQAFDYATTGTQASDTLTAGFATQITGGAISDGFDLSQQNKASILKFNPSGSSTFLSSGTWSAPANTNVLTVNSQQGWMLFVRGDRKNYGQITTQYKIPTITTLRPRGQLNIGSVTIPSSGTLSGIQVIGNPYASAVDFNAITTTGGVVNNKYWVWDPQLGGSLGVGAFVALTRSGSSYIRSAPITGTGTSTYDDTYIPSGAAIMVDFGSGGTITFDEADKATASTTTAFRPVRNIRTTLNSVETDGSTFVSDGVVNLFDEKFDTAVTSEDVIKLTNIEGENFSTKRNGVLLSIEKTKLPVTTDTIFYNWSKVKVREYQLEISTDSLQNSWVDIYLEDMYKKTFTPISLIDTTRYNFKIVREDSGTFKADRLRLVMKYNPPVVTAIQAWQQYSDVKIKWSLENERGVAAFIIERSVDGVNFTEIGRVQSTGLLGKQNYDWIDNTPMTGNNFYRIKGLGEDNRNLLSDIARVLIANPEISIYPNPVTNGEVGIQLTNMPKGMYGISLTNSLGQVITKKEFKHLGGNESLKIPLATVKIRGTYQLQIIHPDNSRSVIKIIY